MKKYKEGKLKRKKDLVEINSRIKSKKEENTKKRGKEHKPHQNFKNTGGQRPVTSGCGNPPAN